MLDNIYIHFHSKNACFLGFLRFIYATIVECNLQF